jgi:hypothetical protein
MAYVASVRIARHDDVSALVAAFLATGRTITKCAPAKRSRRSRR